MKESRVAAGHAFLPAIGRNEVLVVDTCDRREVARVPVAGQPVFAAEVDRRLAEFESGTAAPLPGPETLGKLKTEFR